MANDTIVLVNFTGRKGAGPLIAYEMTKGLIQNNIKVIAVISQDVENLDDWKNLDSCILYAIKTYNSKLNFILRTIFFYFFERLRLKKDISKYKIDVVYCPMICPWTLLINNMFKKSKIVVAVHDPIPHSGEHSLGKIVFSNSVIKKAYKIVVHSKKFVRIIEKKYKKVSDVFYIPLGRHNYDNKKGKPTFETTYKSNMVNFLFFGRISKYKGLHILARAYSKAYEQNKNITLTIAGSGDFSEFEKSYENLKNITIINRWFLDTEVSYLFEGENIVTVLPYLDATQSGVVMVAMEYGSPIIATKTGGLDEQITHGETGILINPDSVDELAQAMLDLAFDYSKRTMIVSNALNEILKLEWRSLAKRLIEII